MDVPRQDTIALSIVIYRVKIQRLQVGFVTISDFQVVKKIQNLNEKYQGMKKNVGRKSTKDEENFNNLLQEIKWTFDISDPKAREILKSDKKHSPEVIEEDLKFFMTMWDQ